MVFRIFDKPMDASLKLALLRNSRKPDLHTDEPSTSTIHLLEVILLHSVV